MASVYVPPRGQFTALGSKSPAQLSRGISRHASLALLTFAALQVWGIATLNHVMGGGLLPIFALVLLMIAALPLTRRVERDWRDLADHALPSYGLAHRYRRDRARLWTLALAVPPMWLGTVAAAAEATTLL